MKPIILITAGPTREYLDPVRFLTNASTGIMGYSIAESAVKRKCQVILVSGPVELVSPKGARLIKVISARDMFYAVKKNFKRADIVIGCAAVSDYSPVKISRKKIKKVYKSINLQLVENPDIIKYAGSNKGKKTVIGFALETENHFRNALEKCKEKKLDAIVLNDADSIGKTASTVTIIKPAGERIIIKSKPKKIIAERILDETLRIWKAGKLG